RAGERLARAERSEVGEIRPGDPPPRAVRRVYLEADGAWLRRQRKRRCQGSGSELVSAGQADRPPAGMLLYVGVHYSQLHQTGRNRWNTVDKQTCVELADLRMFGRQWAWQVARRFDLERTPNQLYLCDGEDGLLRLPGRHFRRALVQLDRFHV